MMITDPDMLIMLVEQARRHGLIRHGMTALITCETGMDGRLTVTYLDAFGMFTAETCRLSSMPVGQH